MKIITQKIEKIWSRITDRDTSDFQILVWGSVVDDRDREPVDLDMIIEYNGERLSENKKDSIEGLLKDSIKISNFNYIDPTVMHFEKIPNLISRSRTSKVYNFDKECWSSFD